MANNFQNFGGFNNQFTPFGSGFNNFNNYIPHTQQYNPQYQQPTNTNKVFVNGLNEVKEYKLYPNSNVLFLDNEKPIIYEKIVDGTGKFEVKTYEFHEITDLETPKPISSTDLSSYVKTTDLDPIKSKLQGIEIKLSKIVVRPTTTEIKKES